MLEFSLLHTEVTLLHSLRLPEYIHRAFISSALDMVCNIFFQISLTDIEIIPENTTVRSTASEKVFYWRALRRWTDCFNGTSKDVLWL